MTAVACPQCPPEAAARPATNRGELAAHLVEDHGVAASRALSEARSAFAITEPAPPLRSAPKPVAGPAAPQEIAMPNRTGKQKKCSKCGTPGHQASTCQRSRAPRPVRPAQGGGSAADTIRAEITKREGEIAALKATLAVLGG